MAQLWNRLRSPEGQPMRVGIGIGAAVIVILLLLLAVIAFIGSQLTRSIGNFAAPEAAFDSYAYEEQALDASAPVPDLAGGAAGFGAEQRMVEDFAAEDVLPSATQAAPGQAQANQVQRLIIRNGTISIIAEDTRAAQQAIEELIDTYAAEGAFVVSANQYGGSEEVKPVIDVSIRVPAERFDQVMDAVAALGIEVTSRTETAQDVTEEYVDLAARVESLEIARDRLLEIVEEAQTTADLLAAEQQLTQREAEINALRGRMQYLSESARLSSITVSIQPFILAQPTDTRWLPAITVRRAIERLINSLQDFADFLINFVIAVLPWLIVFGLIVYGLFRFIRGRVRAGRAKRQREELISPEE